MGECNYVKPNSNERSMRAHHFSAIKTNFASRKDRVILREREMLIYMNRIARMRSMDVHVHTRQGQMMMRNEEPMRDVCIYIQPSLEPGFQLHWVQ
jgi:hypothetical protein